MNTIHLTSAIHPAGMGTLPCRISLHNVEGFMPFVTHLEALQENGSWARAQGNYFGPDDLLDAVADYERRCSQLEVDVVGDEPSLVEAIQDCLPDLEHYASTHGPGPDRRLARLKEVL